MSESDAPIGNDGNAVIYDDPTGGNVPEDALDSIVSEIEGEQEQAPKKETASEPKKVSEKIPENIPAKPEPIDPPSFLSQEERDDFVKLPREAQEALVRVGNGFQKTVTQTAEEKKALEPWMAHIRMLQNDPNYRQHVFGYGQQPATPQQQANTPPADPIEALKWEIRQEVMQELAPKLAPLTQRQEQFEAQRQIDAYAASIKADPLYNEVQSEIVNFVKAQPEGMKQSLWQLLDSNPQAYGEYYQHFRGQVETKKKSGPAGEPVPTTNKATERAPYVERGGAVSGEAQTADAKKREEVKAMRKKIQQGRASSSDIGDYLEMSGLLDSLA